jgi:hypothetical protein
LKLARCRGWQCTLPGVTVHRPRDGGATTLGCPVYTGKGGATPKEGLCIGYKFGCIFRPSDNPNLLFSPYFSLQLDPNQLQQLRLCKYANTTKCTTLCASVLAFSQSFFKGLVTQITTSLNPSKDAKLDHTSGTRRPICKQVCPS